MGCYNDRNLNTPVNKAYKLIRIARILAGPRLPFFDEILSESRKILINVLFCSAIQGPSENSQPKHAS